MREDASQSAARRWLVRIAWLMLFWVAGVAGMSVFALALRALMRAMGFSS